MRRRMRVAQATAVPLLYTRATGRTSMTCRRRIRFTFHAGQVFAPDDQLFVAATAATATMIANARFRAGVMAHLGSSSAMLLLGDSRIKHDEPNDFPLMSQSCLAQYAFFSRKFHF